MAWKWDAKTNRYVYSNDGGMGGDIIADYMAPAAGSAPTTTVPRPRTTVAPTTTTPKATTTTTPKTTTTTTTPKAKAKTQTAATPKGSASTPWTRLGRPETGEVPSWAQPTRGGVIAGGGKPETFVNPEGAAMGDVGGADITELIRTLLATSGSGGGAGGWRPNPAAAAAGFGAAAAQEQAGRTAQQQYNQLAAQTLAQALASIQGAYGQQQQGINTWYDTQQAASEQAIRSAGQEFLSSLPQLTAYASPEFTALTPETQALGQALGAYGATGAEAAQVAQQDAQVNQAIAKMMGQAAGQLGQAETGYMEALKRAGAGGQAAALAGLTQNVLGGRMAEIASSRQAQSQSEEQARALQQQLIAEGIQALMAGKTAGAETRARTVAEYGKPKKKKAARKPKAPAE